MNHEDVAVGSRPEELPFEVHSKGATFSTVLDAIALKSGEYFWSLIQYSDQPCRMDLQF
jgi:hypothetical protein